MKSLTEFLTKNHSTMIASLQTLVGIPSYKQPAESDAPFGLPCAQALDAALNMAEKLGFETHNLDNYIGYVDYGEGESCFGILVHLDVVPEGNGWAAPPYQGEIIDNYMIGRGTSDDKGPAIAALYALAAVKESGLALNRRIRLIFGCDEESGWADIDHYSKFEQLPDIAISPDGEYPVVNSERGILHAAISGLYDIGNSPDAYVYNMEGGTVANVVPGEATATVIGITAMIIENEATKIMQYSDVIISCSEDAEDRVQIRVVGKSAHASTPEEGINAICAMLELLTRLPLDRNEQFKELIKLSNLFPLNDPNGKACDIDFQDEKSGELTCSFGLLSLGKNGYDGTIDIRYPLCTTPEELIKILQDHDLNTSIKGGQAPHYVSPDSELVQTLLKVYEEQTGTPGYCLTIGGGTYARAIENAVTFGCQFPGTESLIHQPNESISLDELLQNAVIIAHAIVALCT